MTKFLGYAVGVACALVLSACGSDSSSGPESSNGNVSKTKISIDESIQTITSYVNDSEDLCVYDSVENRFDWKKDVLMDVDTFDIHYLFKGDTLVLFESEDEGSVFVGGKANSLYGTWKGLETCDYDSDEDEITCDEADNFYDYDYLVTFHKDFVETEVIYSLPDDYANSVWMSCLYYGLEAKNVSFNPRYVFVADSISADSLRELGVEVKSRSKSKISFAFDGKNVSVEFVDVTGEPLNLSYTANVQIDDKTCSLLFASTSDVSESLCSIENIDYFDLEEYETLDSSFIVADYYYRNNTDKFFDCLNAAFGFADESLDGGYDILYKKQGRTSDSDANWKRLERLAKKLSGSAS